ncbi:peptidase domain-containing ABC transporter [Mucilaginibacter jinjuensis]|uniref:Peptidase domain-containing ABC transporter n=1 Tax=Mucilaginibacter jinjuensis TaxID=1176721 RepID=A0ABY7TFH6_9SPHI|nr:peptidase domain-containing ABC transporter [Mucilaginibacter jinjuensis]WCT14483.1 peptidase domain-containing ABC transporter [Mucilaginibacter jinjuensis]
MINLRQRFPFHKQQDTMDCGATCLRIIAEYYGRFYPIQKLRDLSHSRKSGATLFDISEAAEQIGFQTLAARLSVEQLKDVQLPCILHWNQYHYVVLYKIKKSRYYIADPGKRRLRLPETEFKESWFGSKDKEDGIALILSPTPHFYMASNELAVSNSWSRVFHYFYAYKKLFIQLFIAMAAGSFISLIAPLLTQSIVDIGINTHDLHFIYIILIAQVMLFIGATSIDFIQSWILLHISTRINISILTDFLIKILKLPLGFFETKTTGDITQRMSDQQKIESFLTNTSLSTLFSIFNLIVFIILLAYYNLMVFLVSIVSYLVYVVWIVNFLNRRRELNHKQFEVSSKNQNSIIELMNGIVEIKLNNCEKQKRWGWERIQAGVFRIRVKTLALTQYQQAGSKFISQARNIIITFLTVRAVVFGNMTLGGMMAVQYIVGQVNGPIEQLLGFIQAYQDAKISLERLNEIHDMADEEQVTDQIIYDLPKNKDIHLNDVTFSYPGHGNHPVLENIQLTIPEGKITAIVGMSGSGKTTLLKLLLRVFEPEKGEINIGDTPLRRIANRQWRSQCGAVLQDGYLFADSILNNISISDEVPDLERVQRSISVANLQAFIDEQPFGINTQIGRAGNGLSTGQRQRLLIARAVYKNPQYLFFDEATNSLDSNNERIIMNNLQEFFAGRTVVIVAHRLSTVTNADNIILIHKGKIIEEGTHKSLVDYKGDYYNLVRNQLELGS